MVRTLVLIVAVTGGGARLRDRVVARDRRLDVVDPAGVVLRGASDRLVVAVQFVVFWVQVVRVGEALDAGTPSPGIVVALAGDAVVREDGAESSLWVTVPILIVAVAARARGTPVVVVALGARFEKRPGKKIETKLCATW